MVWAGIPLGSLGFLRGLGAVSGIVGSWTYTCVYSLAGTAKNTALVGLCTFALFLSPCAWSMMLFGSTPKGAWTLLAAITASRFALFWFKPAFNQLTQDEVGDNIRGAFTGVKKSLNKLFTVGIAAVAMAFPDPSEFSILVYLSVGAVALAAASFCCYIWRTRDNAHE